LDYTTPKGYNSTIHQKASQHFGDNGRRNGHVQEGEVTQEPIHGAMELDVHQDSEDDEPIARDGEEVDDKES
jgi:hypothetical protein